MQQPENDFIEQIYRDLKLALEKSGETQAHLMAIEEIIDSLTNNINELDRELEKSEKCDKTLKADRKKLESGLEKFKKLLIKVEGLYEQKKDTVNQLVKLKPNSPVIISELSDRELVISVEKMLEERNSLETNLHAMGRYSR